MKGLRINTMERSRSNSGGKEARRKLLVGSARPNVPAICLRNERASCGMFSKRVPPNREGMAPGNFDAVPPDEKFVRLPRNLFWRARLTIPIHI